MKSFKDIRREYQGKYYKFGYIYFRLIKVYPKNSANIYYIDAECINAFLNYFEGNVSILLYDDMLCSGYEKITKKEYMKIRNDVLNKEKNYITSSTDCYTP